MLEITSSQATRVESKGFLGSIVGALMSPRATYADIAARPRWLGALVAVFVATAIPSTILLSTDVGKKAVVDQQVQVIESFGRTVDDAMYQQIERRASSSPYIAAAFQLVLLPIVTLVVAGIAYAIFSGVLGGSATFVQAFSIVAYSNVVSAVRSVFTSPLNYARETLSSPTSLAAVIPIFDDGTLAANLLGSIDLFVIWWIVSLAIGLGVLYRRRTTPIATGLLMVYFVVGFVAAGVRSFLAGA